MKASELQVGDVVRFKELTESEEFDSVSGRIAWFLGGRCLPVGRLNYLLANGTTVHRGEKHIRYGDKK